MWENNFQAIMMIFRRETELANARDIADTCRSQFIFPRSVIQVPYLRMKNVFQYQMQNYTLPVVTLLIIRSSGSVRKCFGIIAPAPGLIIYWFRRRITHNVAL
jgi:hypothetical protein